MYIVFALIFLLVLGMDSYRHVQWKKRRNDTAETKAVTLQESSNKSDLFLAPVLDSSESDAFNEEEEVSKQKGFFVAVYQNRIIVYLEDKKTVYEYTNIDTQRLPQELRSKLSDGFYIPNEEELYHFLESYSS